VIHGDSRVRSGVPASNGSGSLFRPGRSSTEGLTGKSYFFLLFFKKPV
jgi:hypothetical protein